MNPTRSVRSCTASPTASRISAETCWASQALTSASTAGRGGPTASGNWMAARSSCVAFGSWPGGERWASTNEPSAEEDSGRPSCAICSKVPVASARSPFEQAKKSVCS